MRMNMKKYLQYSILPLAVILIFCACKKDLGNYNYDAANVITITTDMANVNPSVVVTPDSIILKQNDSLTVNILLSQTKPSSNLSFQWLITQTASSIANPSQYVVGSSQQLKTKITMTPNLYKLVVRVTDN